MYLNGICFITDRTYCTLPFSEMVKAVLDAGIKFIQLREKEGSRRQMYEDAIRLRELTRSFNAALIINDYADIALAVDADGVHLGQDDLPLKEARKIMGKKIIGISTHNLEQAKVAENGGADYIGFGPVFHTTTKDAGTPRGVYDLRIIKENVNIPVIAIGGITLHNIKSVIDAGADAAAVATAVCKGDITENAKKLISLLNK
ncbi:MAG: thiamine-phosphate diphosphorylase [Nitrospirae bacterium GWC2_42_7]|nr:MAG: thiamine-phosphate diphosphorylase [Nitrospirae bacterium GWC2_42_7]